MTTVAQQTPPTPAQRLAAKIRARTNDTRDILNLLLHIAQGGHDATEHDKLTATGILFDRGYGKAPKQVSDGSGQNPETDNNDVAAIRESPPAVPHKEPESPRLVSQLDDSLHESLGPAPRPCPEPVEGARKTAQAPMSPDPFDDPSSIQSIIREHIISITNDGDTLIDVLMDIAWAEDLRVKPFHRNKAGKMLLDRGAGTDPSRVLNGVCPNCRQRWTTHACSSAHSEHSPNPDTPEAGRVEDLPSDEEIWAKIEADLKRMEEAGILTPDPNAPPIDISNYRMPKDFDSTPYEEEEFAAFKAEIDLRVERQKQWPEIEERRRKKLAQIYPSHTDGEQPDT